MKKRILTIDGGGIKGVIPAAFLAALERQTGKKIVDHFDLIAGTSTGGIIALGLGLGMSAEQILQFYKDEGPNIFDCPPEECGTIRGWIRWHWNKLKRWAVNKHNPQALKNALEKAFGERTLGESQTRLVIPAFDRQRCQIHVFKTAHHPRFATDWQETAVNVALSTSAAPTYFPCHTLPSGISLLDGGVWANNPAGMAVVEAIGVLGWSREDIHVLSLGCSEETLSVPKTSGLWGMRYKMANIFLRGQSFGSIGTARLLLAGSEAHTNQRFYRYNQSVPSGTFALDDADKIKTLEGVGTSMAREALPELQTVFFDVKKEGFAPAHGGT